MANPRLARYDLTGPEGERAIEAGLTEGDWFRSAVPRKRLKELMKRDDRAATIDTAVWLGAMFVSGAAGAFLWGTPWAIPFFAVYGLLYGSASDSRWHESGHGTMFADRKKNDLVYSLACFMTMRNPTVWRWSHTRHHTDTMIVGRDPEIVAMRPARLAKIISNLVGLYDVPMAMVGMIKHAAGKVTAEEATFVPESERPKVYRTARAWLGIYGATAAACVATGSILPAMFIGLPRMYGACMLYVYGLTQHAGLGENVLDHRLNTRSVKMNRLNRFMYSNMNFHAEHHMFPMIPYHRLPDLHEEVKHDLAPMYPSIWATYKEIIPAILKQMKDQTYYVRRELPDTAAPFHPKNDGRAILTDDEPVRAGV
jgi:fatty acid desaturase